MKKFLSLVLALIMTMSLVTVSAGAKDFTDDESLNYEEAVAVMSEIGVIDGYTDGSFKPQNGLTRGAAAKIICNMILGPTTASALRADTAPFKDVAVDNQYAGYIAYCVQQGITSGYTDGTYRPAAPLTNFAFMKMLLCALGYDQNTEGYVGGNCFINVAKQAIGIGLNAGLKTEFDGGKNINREEAALFAFNTLKATMVEYDQKTVVSVAGAEVVLSGNLKDVVNSARTETIKEDNKMQFAEKYFGKLSLKPTTDDFGRPCNEWTNNKNKVGTYVDYTLLVEEFTSKVTYKDLYETIGASNLKNNDYVAYIDGVKATGKDATVSLWTKTDKNTFASTGNGVLTQVFVDNDNDQITVAVINTYLAVAAADYSTKNEKVNLTIYGIKTDDNGQYVKNAGKDGTTKSLPVYGEDIPAAEDLKKDDIVLVTVANKAIQSISEIETISETTISNFKKASYITADGTKYDYASTATFKQDVLDAYDDSNMKNTTYNVYLDQYGYMIGVEIVDASSEYVFITGYETFKNVLSNAKAEANAIFMDGTSQIITVNVDSTLEEATGGAKWTEKAANGNPLLNKWYTYSVDKNGNYDLELVATNNTGKDENQGQDKTNNKEINKSHVSLKGGDGSYGAIAYGNDDTVYLTAKVKNVNGEPQITKADGVVTGVKNASYKLTVDNKEPNGAYYLYNDKQYIIAAVVVGKSTATSENYVFVTSDTNFEGYDASADEYTWTAEGIRNGEKVTLTEVGSKLTYLKNLDTNTFYKFSYDADGNVIDKAPIDWDDAQGDLDGDTYAVQYVDLFNITGVTGYDKNDVELVVQPMKTAWDTKLTMKGHTLYVKADLDVDFGLDIAPDAKAVLIDKHDGKSETEIFDAESGNVKAAIDEMDSAKYNGSMYAVMKDGVATTVIIVDDDNHVGTNVNGKPVVSQDITVTVGLDKVTYAVAEGATPTAADLAAAIEDAMNAAGYTQVTVNLSSTPKVVTAEKSGQTIVLPIEPAPAAEA